MSTGTDSEFSPIITELVAALRAGDIAEQIRLQAIIDAQHPELADDTPPPPGGRS